MKLKEKVVFILNKKAIYLFKWGNLLFKWRFFDFPFEPLK